MSTDTAYFINMLPSDSLKVRFTTEQTLTQMLSPNFWQTKFWYYIGLEFWQTYMSYFLKYWLDIYLKYFLTIFNFTKHI